MKKRGVMVGGSFAEEFLDVPLAVGALVLVHGLQAGTRVEVAGRLMTHRMFQLPPDVDTVRFVKSGDVVAASYAIEWFPIKPAYEQPDPTPVALPVGAGKPESLQTTIARLVRRQVSEIAQREGFDPEEEEDFEDDGDEFDEAPTPYEFERLAERAELEQKREKAARDFIKRKKAEKRSAEPSPPAEPAAPAAASTTGDSPSP